MTLSFTTADGLTLRADSVGDDDASPVVLLHGGGQTRHAWGGTAAALAAAGWRAIAVDLRGHGDSDRSPDGDYRLDAFASDVRDIAAALDSPPVLVGASLGGGAALLATGEPPAADVAALVLVDVAHRFEVQGTDRIIAFMRSAPDGFASPGEAAAAVARYLPHREAPADTSGLERNLRLRDGRWRWHWDPRLLGATGTPADPVHADEIQARMRVATEGLTVPTLLVRGAISDVVSPQIAREFGELAPHAQIVDVSGATHMVAGDDNDRFTATVAGFLAGVR